MSEAGGLLGHSVLPTLALLSLADPSTWLCASSPSRTRRPLETGLSQWSYNQL